MDAECLLKRLNLKRRPTRFRRGISTTPPRLRWQEQEQEMMATAMAVSAGEVQTTVAVDVVLLVGVRKSSDAQIQPGLAADREHCISERHMRVCGRSG